MNKRILRSAGFQLVLRYIALFGLSVVILLGFLYWATLGYMERQIEETIETDIQALAETYTERGFLGLTRLISQRVQSGAEHDAVYLLTDPNFVPIAGTLTQWPSLDTTDEPWLRFAVASQTGTRPYLAREFRLNGGFHLLVARDIRDLQRTQGLIVRSLIGGTILTTVLALLGGIIMSRSMMRKIESINDTSRAIVKGDLSRRIPLTGSGDDIDELSSNLNHMMDELQRLMEEIKRVSDNIAHDLRTPLSRLINQLESLGSEPQYSPQTKEKLKSAGDAAQELLHTFNALLKIARIESLNGRKDWNTFDVQTLIEDAAELYEPICQDQGQSLATVCNDAVNLRGDRDLLFQSITNLIDNATKYASPNAKIEVFAKQSSGAVMIGVRDSGPGIDEKDLARVTKRFVRLDQSRTKPGNGLGLALVDAVAHFHDGQLTLSSNHPGLAVVLTVPDSLVISRRA